MYYVRMNYDEGNVFFKSRTSFFTGFAVLTTAFIGLIALQNHVLLVPAKIFLSIFLVLITFLMNLTLGTPGFIFSMIFNVFQIVLYAYKFILFKDSVPLYLMGIAVTSMIISLTLQLFLRRIDRRLGIFKKRAEEEQKKRIQTETTALIENAMQRTSLIVKSSDTQQREKMAGAIEISRSSSLDPLTTLPDKDMLIGRIDRFINDRIMMSQSSPAERATGHPVYVIYLYVIDSTRFSTDLGHRTTDLFIQCMAHRLRETADPRDCVGRIYGNEFAVLTSRDMTEPELCCYIETLRKAIGDTSTSHVYAGYSQYPRDGRFPGELLNAAEEAMRSAIASSTFIESYTSIRTISNSFLREMSPEDRHEKIHRALVDNHIYMVYQPRFDSEKKFTGYEAFVRWEDPEHGYVDTQSFLYFAEKTGDIYDIGRVASEEALDLLFEINKKNPDLTMTINMSVTQLKSPEIADDLLNMIQRSGANPRNIIIDIPEEALLSDLQEIGTVLEKWSSEGITLALDNFGRCYSSLNNIPLFPISIVKLDGHFTSDLKEGSPSRILCSSIIRLLEETEIPVDATGVENEEQFEALKESGCVFFQGKYLCKPLRRADAVKYKG